MKCKNCGYEPVKGRPRQVDDDKVRRLRNAGKSLAAISLIFGVTRGAVQASLKRSAK